MATDLIEEQRRAKNSTLCDMLLAIAENLRAHAEFNTSSISILTGDEGDIDTRISESCGNLGSAAVVLFAGTEGRNSVPGLCFNGASFILEISEFSPINRGNGGRPALELAEAAARITEEFRDSSGRQYNIERIIPAPSLPEGADVAMHVLLSTSTVKIRRTP